MAIQINQPTLQFAGRPWIVNRQGCGFSERSDRGDVLDENEGGGRGAGGGQCSRAAGSPENTPDTRSRAAQGGVRSRRRSSWSYCAANIALLNVLPIGGPWLIDTLIKFKDGDIQAKQHYFSKLPIALKFSAAIYKTEIQGRHGIVSDNNCLALYEDHFEMSLAMSRTGMRIGEAPWSSVG
jgi:hypothetical protein